MDSISKDLHYRGARPAEAMKVKELIALLQKQDPENRVTVNGEILWDVGADPGYWDGPFAYVERNAEERPTKFVASSEGTKVKIQSFSLEDAVMMYPELPVDIRYTYDDKSREQNLRKRVDEWRQEAARIDHDVERSFFVRWALDQELFADTPTAAAAFDRRYPKLTIVADDLQVLLHGKSQVDRWEAQWSRDLIG